MDKHTACILLFAELNTLRVLPPDLLIARIGVAQSRTLLVQDQPLEIQATLDGADRHRTAA